MMTASIKVETIRSREELEEVTPFQVDKLLWGTQKIPKTYGYLGFVPSDGFYLKMICEEADPLRTYTEDQDPVYQDSAMEAFFLFESEKERGPRPTYLNFEANANGALIAAYGTERTYRTYFGKEAMEAFECKALIENESWSVSIRIPIAVLEEVYGPLSLGVGSTFSCNFYKLSETAAVEHYAAYAPIPTKIPSFHLPEHFAEAEIVGGQNRAETP